MASGPLKSYFAVQLGYSSINSKVTDKYIIDWFEKAGAQEDSPLPRTPNHFLDPISNRGFSGYIFGRLMTGEPTAIWAQRGIGQQSPGGSYSWQDAREYFYTALTSTTGSHREENLGQSFRALGQVMHLIADMSVPEHTRDNSHITIYTIEKWAEDAFNPKTQKPFFKSYSSRLTRALNNPVPPDPSLLQQTGKFPGAPIPISNLYDSEQYKKGSNPSITATGPIGLAEYTNANFFSRNTIFKDYDYPATSSVEQYEEIDIESGKPMKFIRKIKDGELVEHLAQANTFHKYLPIITSAYTIVNDKIYADYLEKMIPRAVGYAGALVDYFYRGKLTVTPATNGITFRSIKLNVQNNTPGETMGVGEVKLIIRYKAHSEWPLGGNKYQLNYPPEDSSPDKYTYKVSTPQNVDLTNPQTLTFDFSTETLPYFFDDMSMQLVFKGKLGNEEGAVAVSELKPIDGVYSDFTIYLPASGIYAKASGSTLGATFNELKVKATTDIPAGLSGGSFELALEYRKTGGDPFQSLPVDTEPANAAGYVLRVPEKNGVSILQPGTPVELVFDLSSVPLPVSATDVYLNIIYKNSGTSKAMAVGYRDISEPTPVDIFNNTDYVCVNNQWFPAGDPAAIALADQLGNHNGINDDIDPFKHNFTNIYYDLTPSTNPLPASATNFDFFEPGPIVPATFRRLGFVLTDYAIKYSSLRDVGHINPADKYTGGLGVFATLENGMGVKHQTDSDGITRYPLMYNMRGKLMWGGTGTVFGNMKLPANAICDWALLPIVP